MPSDIFRITPLGGLRQIGSNMVLFQGPSDNVLVDSGLLFPNEDAFDINYLIPDLTALPATPTDLVITHGHEDHIGAIQHIVEKFPEITLWATPFTAGVIRKKMNRNGGKHPIKVYPLGGKIVFKDFTFHSIQVNHSIPETQGMLVKDNEGQACAFYVSDFKVDSRTTYEPYFDFKRLVALSKDCSLRLLMADSTNILSRQARCTSEFQLINEFEDIIGSTKGRIFITLFASNVHRVQTILNACEKHRRPLVAHGMSVQSYIQTAVEEGILIGGDKIRTPEQVVGRDKSLVVLLSGCQGDFRGTLRRVAIGEDSSFKPTAEDTFVFSSRPIPGNEKKVGHLINTLVELGARVITPDDRLVHASGHACKDDLRDVYKTFAPTHAMPIHGETQFLKEHQDFVNKEFPTIKTFMGLNFDMLSVDSKLQVSLDKAKDAPKPIMIIGNGVSIDSSKISERRKIATQGLVAIAARMDNIHANEPILDIQAMGLPEEGMKAIPHFRTLAVDLLRAWSKKPKEQAAEELRVATRRYFSNLIGQRPVAIVQLI